MSKNVLKKDHEGGSFFIQVFFTWGYYRLSPQFYVHLILFRYSIAFKHQML